MPAPMPYRVRYQYPGRPEHSTPAATITRAVMAAHDLRGRGADARVGVPDGRRFRELTRDEVLCGLTAAGDLDWAAALLPAPASGDPAPEDAGDTLSPALRAQVTGLQGAITASADRAGALPPGFTQEPAPGRGNAVTITHTATGRSIEVGLCDLYGARKALAAFCGGTPSGKAT